MQKATINTEKLVRIGINKDGILIMAGDPLLKIVDKDYMDLIREGGMVKNIPLSEFKKQKLYEPYNNQP